MVNIMPAAETVAKLNRMGGKSPTERPHRLRARLTDIFGSPEKPAESETSDKRQSRRSSGRLQPKRLSTNGATTTRRTSFSVPDDDEEHSTSPPKPKTKTTLKKSKKTNNQSPLKRHGYNVQLKENSKVNLDDSPAKHTRSKKTNPLGALAKQNLPTPENSASRAKESSKQDLRKAPYSPAIPKGNSHKRKAEEWEALETSDEEGSRPAKRVVSGARKLSKRTHADEPAEVEVDENEEQGDKDPPSDQHAQSVPRRGRGRPRKVAAEVEVDGFQGQDDDNSSTDRQTQSTLSEVRRSRRKDSNGAGLETEAIQPAQEQEQRDEANEESREELEKHMERFTRNIEDAIKVNACAQFWSACGGAAYMIKHNAPPDGPQSTRGKAVIKASRALISRYRGLISMASLSSTITHQIEEYIDKIEGLCKTLEHSDRSAEDRLVVRDMFLFIIPGLVVTLKYFLRGRCKDGSMDGLATKELIRLLDMTINVCNRARAWRPSPSTLDSGIKLAVRNDILANLKRIRMFSKAGSQCFDRIEQDRMYRENLGRKQALALQTIFAKVSSREVASRTLVITTVDSQIPHTASKITSAGRNFSIRASEDDIQDIDDIESVEDVRPRRKRNTQFKKNDFSTKANREHVARSQREPTADLPPPPSVSLTQEEKVALLNGLQQYTDKDRYNDILNDSILGPVLGTRDLDDLMESARSFSRVMASKMGSDAYRADSSYWWLHSTDPE